ncbi:MAG: hypothetical protein R6V13_08575 [Anaerolineae bacterium]
MTKAFKLTSLSIAQNVTLILIIVLTLVLAGIGAFNYLDSKSQAMIRLSNMGQNAVGRFQLNLQAPIWNLENQQAQKIIQSEMADENIYAVIVREANGESIFGPTFCEGRIPV